MKKLKDLIFQNEKGKKVDNSACEKVGFRLNFDLATTLEPNKNKNHAEMNITNKNYSSQALLKGSAQKNITNGDSATVSNDKNILESKLTDNSACETARDKVFCNLSENETIPLRNMKNTTLNYSRQVPKEKKSYSLDNLNKFATKLSEKQRSNDRFQQIESQLQANNKPRNNKPKSILGHLKQSVVENNEKKSCEASRVPISCNLPQKQTSNPLCKMKDTQKHSNSQAPLLKGSKKYIEFWQFIFDKSHDDGSYKINHITEAKKYGVTRMTIHRWLKKGVKEGYIKNYKPGQNIVSKRKIGWQNLLKTRFTVVHKANQYKQSKDVTLSPKGDNFSMYTQNPTQIFKLLVDKKFNLAFHGRTSVAFVEDYHAKAEALQKTVLKIRKKQIEWVEKEIKKLEKRAPNLVRDMMIKAKRNKLQRLMDELVEFKEIMANFFDKLKHAAFHNIAQHFWMICEKFRVSWSAVRYLLQPKSRFKVNFRPLTYQQELDLIQYFIPFSKISQELVELYGVKFYNMCLEGFRKEYSKLTHEKSEYWLNHSKFKLSKGKYYTLEILNFELKAYVKRQAVIFRKKQKLGQKYVEPKLYCHA